MAIQTGDRLVPSRLNPQRQSSQLSANYTLTATPTNLTGTSFTITTSHDNAFYVATWTGDFQLITAGTITCAVGLMVDGALLSIPQAVWNPANVAAGARETEGQSHSAVLATAGAHTFRLQGWSTATAPAVGRLNPFNTALTVIVFP